MELTRDNLDDVLANGPIGAVLAIEGGDAINGSLGVLRTMYRLGVRAMTLVWNRENAIATPAILNAEEGLKPFGFECVRGDEPSGHGHRRIPSEYPRLLGRDRNLHPAHFGHP